MSVLQDMMSNMSVLQDLMSYMSVLQDMLSLICQIFFNDFLLQCSIKIKDKHTQYLPQAL